MAMCLCLIRSKNNREEVGSLTNRRPDHGCRVRWRAPATGGRRAGSGDVEALSAPEPEDARWGRPGAGMSIRSPRTAGRVRGRCMLAAPMVVVRGRGLRDLEGRRAPVGYPGGGLVRQCRRIRVRCSVSHFRTAGRDEKGLAHLAILLRRVGAAVGDHGSGGVRWRRVGGATLASGGVKPIDGSGLRRTKPRSRGGGRGVTRSREGIA